MRPLGRDPLDIKYRCFGLGIGGHRQYKNLVLAFVLGLFVEQMRDFLNEGITNRMETQNLEEVYNLEMFREERRIYVYKMSLDRLIHICLSISFLSHQSFDWLIPVSYTHLDVYKRQRLQGPEEDQFRDSKIKSSGRSTAAEK